MGGVKYEESGLHYDRIRMRSGSAGACLRWGTANLVG